MVCHADSLPSLSTRNSSILIIGAGIAGLAAARYLQDHHLSVTVLEGRDRIGGRIWTDTSLGAPIDLGGAWIHGIEGNPLTELAQQFNCPWIPADFDALDLVDGGGRHLTSEEHDQIDRASAALWQGLESTKKTAPLALSVQAGVDSILNSLHHSLDLTDTIHRGLIWTLGAELEIEYACNATELSWRYWNEDRDLPGHEVVLPQGYGQIVQKLAEGLDIRLDHRVQAIEYGNIPIRILTNQGEFRADQVILTLPLGVLKQETVRFIPELLHGKQEAIRRLAVGTLNKIVLKFAKQIWPSQPHRFGALKTSAAETIEFWNYAHYVNQPILIALVGGGQALELERMSREEGIAHIMTDLRHILGQNLPDPIDVITTRWHSDPFSLGSYSHVAPGAQIEDYDLLAEPLMDRLFFAGEATHSVHPCTVHGAYLSGLREAKRLEQILTESRNRPKQIYA